MNGLSLVIPTHNAENFIEHSLVEYHNFFSKKFKNFEMIVVCNACTDNTYSRVLSLKKKIPLIVLNEPNQGKGHAVILGLNHSRYELLGFLDSDNPYNLDEVFKMINFLNYFDMVIATKFSKPLKYQSSFLRRLFSLAGAIVFRFLFALKFNDTQAGAKFMKRELWEKIKRPFICTGFEFDMELLYKSSKINAKIKEHHISPNKTDFSTVKLRILPGLVYRLIKLRFIK